MELTFVTDLGQTFVVEIDPNMELENVMALLEAEVRPWISVWVVQSLANLLYTAVLNTSQRTKHLLRGARATGPEGDDPAAGRAGRERDAPPAAQDSQRRRKVRVAPIHPHALY